MNQKDPSLVDEVSENISTDTISDLKTGIYNLFVNLINNQIISYGPEMAVRVSIDFLQEIIYNFNKAIQPEQEQE